MKRNMGVLDRLLRVFVVAPVLTAIGLSVGPTTLASWVLYALAGVMLLTSAVGFCPTYRLLGVTTVGAWSRLCSSWRVPLAR